MIEITPNYELMLSIILTIWILKGIVLMLVGMTGMEKQKQTKYGGIEIFCGLITLLIAIWVML